MSTGNKVHNLSVGSDAVIGTSANEPPVKPAGSQITREGNVNTAPPTHEEEGLAATLNPPAKVIETVPDPD